MCPLLSNKDNEFMCKINCAWYDELEEECKVFTIGKGLSFIADAIAKEIETTKEAEGE